MPQPERPLNVFISYHWEDNQYAFPNVVNHFVDRLDHLYRTGTDMTPLAFFFDKKSMHGGDRWAEKIRQKVHWADVFIPIVTREYFRHEWCLFELNAFLEEKKQEDSPRTVFPVILDGRDEIRNDSPVEEIRLIADFHPHEFMELVKYENDVFASASTREMIAVRDDLQEIHHTILAWQDRQAAAKHAEAAKPTPDDPKTANLYESYTLSWGEI
jgi:hypothetical protein